MRYAESGDSLQLPARLAVNAIAQEYPDRFSILYRQDEMQRRPDNWHFKLYDEGLYCYASYHQFESEKRKYVVYRKGVGDNFVDVDEFVASFANQRCSGKYVGQA